MTATAYVSIDVLNEPYDLGPDEDGRARCAFNIGCTKRYSRTFWREVVQVLELANVGKYEEDIFVSTKSTPVGAGPFLTIITTPGLPALRTHNSVDHPAYQRPGAQLVGRASTWEAAERMAQQAYDALVGVRNASVTPV
jgi:hypothetical protein